MLFLGPVLLREQPFFHHTSLSGSR
uniref:Uncharacterized protein n=1 Tax=Anguilla anguilla TaxID=7936 RepID=A0A0E9QH72_ANGAN